MDPLTFTVPLDFTSTDPPSTFTELSPLIVTLPLAATSTSLAFTVTAEFALIVRFSPAVIVISGVALSRRISMAASPSRRWGRSSGAAPWASWLTQP